MKRSFVRVAALLLAVILFAFVLSSCGGSEVEKLISKFEKACVELDVDSILDCMKPSVSKPIRLVLKALGLSDINSAADEIFAVLNIINFEGETPGDILATLKIKPEAFVYNEAEDECTVTAILSYELRGETKSSTVVFDCVLQDGTWYIDGARR